MCLLRANNRVILLPANSKVRSGFSSVKNKNNKIILKRKKMNKLYQRILISGVILLIMSFSVLSNEPNTNNSLHRKIENAINNEGLVGVVWSTTTPEKITIGASGLAEAKKRKPLTAQSKVQTASIVKTFIATGILRLVTEGKLTLDTPVAEILPSINFDNQWSPRDPVRVRHLLDHTSGLDDARLWQIMSMNAQPKAMLKVGLSQNSLLVRSRPGSRLSYSNIGYTLAGMVIEQVTGQNYEDYLDQHLLQPLEMYSSTFNFVSQVGPYKDPALAMGHFENGVSQAALPMYLRPAGQFTTSAYDMALFAKFLMGNGKIGDHVFIHHELLKAMATPTTTDAVSAGLIDVGYGLGLSNRDRHNVVGKCHSGSTIGYKANFCLFPEQQKAFFIAFNADVETANYKQFDNLLIEALNINKKRPTTQAQAPANIHDWQGIYVLAPSRFESFAYLDYVLHFVTVSWNEQALVFSPFQSATKYLHPVGGNLFRAEDKVRTSHVLVTLDDGRRGISDGFRTYQQLSVWQIVPIWLSVIAGLSGLVWIIMYGVVCTLKRQLSYSSMMFVPFLSTLLLFLPVPFFFGQSFMALGDMTLASLILTVVTALLPIAMIFGLWRSFYSTHTPVLKLLNRFALFCVLQWCCVLAIWGLMPIRLWG